MKRVAMFGVVITLLAGAMPVYAQSYSNQYWCNSYWSSTPCNYGAYNNNYYQQYSQYQYQYQTNPNAYYYQYQNSYYPNNYNYYPQQNYQYYYPAPTCTITYTVTNNPNYWSGTMNNQAIQLSWSSNYATSAYISVIGTTTPSGTRVVNPSGYTEYVMTVNGPGGTNTCRTYYQPPQYYYQQTTPYNWNQYNYNYGYNYGYPYYW